MGTSRLYPDFFCKWSIVGLAWNSNTNVIYYTVLILNVLSHINNIDVLYNDIVNCLHTAVSKCIPCKSVKYFKQIPGWNDLVKDSHELARQSFILWVAHGKPKVGFKEGHSDLRRDIRLICVYLLCCNLLIIINQSVQIFMSPFLMQARHSIV